MSKISTPVTEDIFANLADVEAEAAAERAQLEANREARELQEQEERARARREAERLSRLRFNAQRRPHLVKIVEVMNTMPNDGFVATLQDADAEGFGMQIVMRGQKLGTDTSFSEEKTRISKWRSKGNGRLRCAVGDYGERQSFPQRKDGTFNYESIAITLRNLAYRRWARAKAEQAERDNKNAVMAVRKHVGLKADGYSYNITASAVTEKPVNIKFSFDRSMTQEEAIKLADALKALGIILK